MLHYYNDLDVVSPIASSLVIRICHASALHTDGRTMLAWHSFDEALRLAEQMRLYDERSYNVLHPLEAQLRRFAFWQLCILDKYAALVEEKPMRLHAFSIGRPITTKLQSENDIDLLMPESNGGIKDLEPRLKAGFFSIQQLWQTAAAVYLDLQMLS